MWIGGQKYRTWQRPQTQLTNAMWSFRLPIFPGELQQLLLQSLAQCWIICAPAYCILQSNGESDGSNYHRRSQQIVSDIRWYFAQSTGANSKHSKRLFTLILSNRKSSYTSSSFRLLLRKKKSCVTPYSFGRHEIHHVISVVKRSCPDDRGV